jgi:hypothetical protein
MNPKFRWFSAALAVLAIAALASVAQAAGTFRLRSTEVQEVSGGWHVYVDITLPRPPSIAHLPMKFLFTKTVEYERALTDNSKDPVLNRQPLVGQTPSVESLDVDFADPRGKIFNRTRFDFSLTRTRGYEAAEYSVKLRTSDGIDVGGSATLILKGDNPVVDRRSITFSAKDKTIKKVDNGIDGGTEVAQNDNGDNGSAAPVSTDVTPTGSAAPFVPAEAYQKTPEEELREKPKGCGCTVPGLGPPAQALLLGSPFMLAGLVLARRKRRRPDARP